MHKGRETDGKCFPKWGQVLHSQIGEHVLPHQVNVSWIVDVVHTTNSENNMIICKDKNIY